ncbi:hypothetical protein VF14_28355 [Nostoc linckia z18]|jgi:hypothetical protein|uniref:Uncharacterized protein n=3 Tax=Nostoc TaxID=1177 RepID=A0A9Q5Z7M7_NOSLI|nr:MULTISPECIES: hypothetical protein [Nostoc]MDZ8015184.1 hypothetical protein [Nostoc sp. ZfuVER08]PHK25494.1 hypothetical protein VF12_36875 [Nostoc linckia z15]PHK43880.1 hypothetical protein VF13_24720 [Nostoc linckia z16]MBD2611834.1 hypothetical protein [Nostoc punctiforme FACHB-252]PHJ56794.1 hypothetical protein VF03_37225 [Nostoc linckia z2]
MISPNLLEIERSIRALSVEEQLWLLESIAREIREREYKKDNFTDVNPHQKESIEIANEQVILPKFSLINDEFASSEIL